MENTTISIDHDRVALIAADKQMIAEAEIRVKDSPPITLEQLLEKVRK
jgi:replicative DNA helicase